MSKYALVAQLGSIEQVNAAGPYTAISNLPFLVHRDKRDVSMHGFLDELKRLHLIPSEVAMDLLIVAATFYAADIRIGRTTSDDSWTRQIDLYIPVSDEALWNSQRVTLQTIFGFLTGDIWRIFFRPRVNSQLAIAPQPNTRQPGMSYSTDTVCLFSGGLDSFLGAIELLNNGTVPLLVSHHKDTMSSPYQNQSYNKLKHHFIGQQPERIDAYVSVPAQSTLFSMRDNNERGRSFLFLTLGSVAASCLGVNAKLQIPENGLISLNIPLTLHRVGSHSTRTTHPYYLGLFQDLLDALQLNVTIENPFQFLTKGEMLAQSQHRTLATGPHTMSCSRPHDRRGSNSHCGYCVPCLIRQASFAHAGIPSGTPYRVDIFNPAELNRAVCRENIVAFRHMIRKAASDPNYLQTIIRTTGPLGVDVSDYIDVYQRGLNEVDSLLSTVRF